MTSVGSRCLLPGTFAKCLQEPELIYHPTRCSHLSLEMTDWLVAGGLLISMHVFDAFVCFCMLGKLRHEPLGDDTFRLLALGEQESSPPGDLKRFDYSGRIQEIKRNQWTSCCWGHCYDTISHYNRNRPELSS